MLQASYSSCTAAPPAIKSLTRGFSLLPAAAARTTLTLAISSLLPADARP
jgi:hypothetical protein